MSFYDDFENFDDSKDDDDDNNDDDDDIDDDDDDDYDDFLNVDDAAVADFRSRMGNVFGESSTSENSDGGVDELIRRATGATEKDSKDKKDWARAIDLENGPKIEGGMVLIANPEKFCSDFGNKSYNPSTSLLNKFGLTLPPPADLDPDRRADLLPVLCILDRHPLKGSQAVLLNRRTGYLLGDLEQQQNDDNSNEAPPQLTAFMIQPLWFGGTSSGNGELSSSSTSGLDMLHQCSMVYGAKELTEDGLYWGGDPVQAQDAMSEPREDGSGEPYTGFDFKFFVQSTRWLPTVLEREVREGTWFCASVSKEVLFKPRDRMGTRRAKPLWTEIMELMGGNFLQTRNILYDEE
eukprot:CAMPEP_0194137138 /NCGR_PEP_ID=MMETSP0152-20130528/7063_1 /TAXON_ID=1049557 /ORGANISM="Thalassiothrix antarctica, Strain L6-D1" /LENGTH=349 /DNA_ID=CAMNT_0038834037 /DNA_START=329 /DNA_END=1378 /DNA_ORIENTATION=-